MGLPTAAEIRAVAFDLDGSLARADHRVSPRALRALQELEARGVPPIIVTGRSVAAARVPWGQAGLSAPVISCNGAVIEDPASGEHLVEHHLPIEVVSSILDVAERVDVTPTLWTPTRIHASRRDASVALVEALNNETVAVGPLARVASHEPVVKAMLGGSKERLDAMTGFIVGEVPWMMRSLNEFFETTPPGVSKAEALRLVLDRLGVPAEACLGVGDGDTDVEWLTSIGMAVAPANARATVRDVVARVIGHHDEDGVAAFLEEFFALDGRV